MNLFAEKVPPSPGNGVGSYHNLFYVQFILLLFVPFFFISLFNSDFSPLNVTSPLDMPFGYFDLQFTLSQLVEPLLKNDGNFSPKHLEDTSFRNTTINLFTFFYILLFKNSTSLYPNQF